MAGRRPPRSRRPSARERDLWVGFKPYGIGETEAATTTTTCSRRVWENRDNLPYAWRILRKGVCDGCALGVAGFHDWTISGVHLCTTRLNLLRVNTMGALDHALLADVDAAATAARPRAARPRPARPPDGAARAASPGFTQVSWDEALDLVADRIRATDARPPRALPHRARHHQRGVLRRAEGRRASSAPTTSTTRRASATRRRPTRSSRRSASPRRRARTPT